LFAGEFISFVVNWLASYKTTYVVT